MSAPSHSPSSTAPDAPDDAHVSAGSDDPSGFVLLNDAVRDAMVANGFRPLATEWWHFTLKDEPYPDTYFTFPVSADAVRA